MNYGDILWVEDFDDGDNSPVEKKIENYYTKQRAFRVDVQRFMLPLLKTLSDEKNFSKYSCAVLDINLTEGFDSIQDEFDEIKELLTKNQIRILDEHDPDQDAEYEDFSENAGYYVYLYLIRRGMPAERICMLTANKGNTTDDWEKNFAEKDPFKNAGFVSPEAFDRTTEREKFHAWLDKTLTPPYRLRACIVGMSRCAEKFLSDSDENKVVLQNLPRIPLRLSTDEKVADRVFVSALREIVQPWESTPEDAKPLYQTTLKLTRNWLAHNILTKELSLLATAFLFGIGLRGLFGKKIPENADEFKLWEKELLALLTDMDKKFSPSLKEISGELIMKSAKEFFKRVTDFKYYKWKIPLSTDIDRVIDKIGRKKNGIEPRLDTDLIRNFLHSVYPIYLAYPEGNIPDQNRNRLSITFKLDEKTFYNRRDNIEAKYLAAVKNTLARAVDK